MHQRLSNVLGTLPLSNELPGAGSPRGGGTGMFSLDRTGNVVVWSYAAARLTGHPPSRMIGLHCADGPLAHHDGAGRRLCPDCPMQRTIREGAGRQAVVALCRADGSVMRVRATMEPIFGEEGEVLGAVQFFTPE